jgi:hypothetical protein
VFTDESVEVTNVNFEALYDSHIGWNMWCTNDFKSKVNFMILMQVACEMAK